VKSKTGKPTRNQRNLAVIFRAALDSRYGEECEPGYRAWVEGQIERGWMDVDGGRSCFKFSCGDHDEAFTVGRVTVSFYRITRERIMVPTWTPGGVVQRPGYATEQGSFANIPVSDVNAVLTEMQKRFEAVAKS
jgi:hypothetical protein